MATLGKRIAVCRELLSGCGGGAWAEKNYQRQEPRAIWLLALLRAAVTFTSLRPVSGHPAWAAGQPVVAPRTSRECGHEECCSYGGVAVCMDACVRTTLASVCVLCFHPLHIQATRQ